jgi:multidrug efflux pump subunit AcrA (membrane-fusion protein)
MAARRSLIRTIVALAAVSLFASACAPDSAQIVASGRVTSDEVTVSMPTLPVPSPAIGAATARSRTATAVALAGLGRAQRIESVTVEVGDTVTAGQEVARLDDAMLAADIGAAKAAARAARAQVDVLDARLGDVTDARATIAETRVTVSAASAKLTTTRAELTGSLATARAQRAKLQALLDALTGAPGAGRPPTGTAPPGPTPDPATLRAAIARLDAGIATMTAGLAKIDAGLAKARAGLAKLSTASAKTADARSALRRVRAIAREGVHVRDAAVALAAARRDLAVLSSPCAGTVVSAAGAGEALAPGAPVVTIRPTGAVSVEVWLAPEKARRLALGDTASVRTDGGGAALHATVTRIGVRAVYPPSWVATTDVHMTRAIPVRVTLDDSSAVLHPGVPADVTFDKTAE